MTSPELVLVDPDLGELARAQLPDAPIRLGWTPITQDSAIVTTRSDQRWRFSRLGRRLGERRLLVGCAVVTALVVLLVDLRVGPGDTPATQTTAPSSSPLLGSAPRPSKTPSKPIDRRFVWASTPNASGYHVEFFRASRRVFLRDTTEPEVVVPASWMYAGSRRMLRPGEYTWYVWPIVRGRRVPGATVQATVSIPG